MKENFGFRNGIQSRQRSLRLITHLIKRERGSKPFLSLINQSTLPFNHWNWLNEGKNCWLFCLLSMKEENCAAPMEEEERREDNQPLHQHTNHQMIADAPFIWLVLCWGACRAIAWSGVHLSFLLRFVDLLYFIPQTTAAQGRTRQIHSLLNGLVCLVALPSLLRSIGGSPPITHNNSATQTNHQPRSSAPQIKIKLFYFSLWAPFAPPRQTIRNFISIQLLFALVPHCPSTIKSNHPSHSEEKDEIDLCVEWAAAVILAPAPRGSPNATSIDSIHKLKFIHFIKLTVA